MASQELGNLHRGMPTTVAPGEPLSRSMGEYGKGHTFNVPAIEALMPTKPTSPVQENGMAKHARNGTLPTQAYKRGGKT